MRYIYNISIYLFGAAMWLSQPFVRKARLRLQGTRCTSKSCPAPRCGVKILVHCASLGEFEQGRPLIEALRVKYPDAWLVLTFFSPSGYEPRKEYNGVNEVRYLPLDTPSAARRFAEELKPDMAYFVKYEYWANILRELHGVGCRIYLVSAIFRSQMSFFRSAWRGGNFFRGILRYYEQIFVQDDRSKELLSTIGISENVTVAGDTRFDRVAALVESAPRLPLIEKFVAGGGGGAGALTVVCGSTWPADEQLLLSLMAAHPEWRFVVAPHEISRSRIDRFVEASGRSAIIYTEGTVDDRASLLMIDCIGVLSAAYQYGQISYIGGGFGAGIHNTLEAATWGMPIVFGPRYAKFAEARELIALGGAFSVGSEAELLDVFDRLNATYKQCGEIAKDYVHRSIGATNIIMNFE